MYITKAAKKHIDALDDLRTNKEMIKYCKDNLTKVGEGSSRIVFALNDKLVVKIAKGSVGVKQNENEIRVWNLVDYSFPSYKRSFAAIEVKEGHWKDFFIVMERLDKCKQKSLFGTKALRAWRSGGHDKMNITAKRLFKHVQDTDDTAFTNNISDICPRNLGTTRNGLVKMIDYGFSTNIWNGISTGKYKKNEVLYNASTIVI